MVTQRGYHGNPEGLPGLPHQSLKDHSLSLILQLHLPFSSEWDFVCTYKGSDWVVVRGGVREGGLNCHKVWTKGTDLVLK